MPMEHILSVILQPPELLTDTEAVVCAHEALKNSAFKDVQTTLSIRRQGTNEPLVSVFDSGGIQIAELEFQQIGL